MDVNWFRHFFQGMAVELWHQATAHQHTVAEVDFAWRELLLEPGSRVLDLPCGHGRHSVELARRGCQVTGIDLSMDALNLARDAAGAANARVDWQQLDASEPLELPPCDAAITLGNSFGYFGPERTATFVQSVARSIRPGGRWLINSGLAAESFVANFGPELNHPVGDIGFQVRNEYLMAESCLHSTCIFTREGHSETREFWHWVFTVGEIRRMLAAAGLTTLSLYSSIAGEPYVLGSPQLYLVAEKPQT